MKKLKRMRRKNKGKVEKLQKMKCYVTMFIIENALTFLLMI